jgi:hypothetical protein
MKLRSEIIVAATLLSACGTAYAGEIYYNDITQGTGWVAIGAAGTFNTGGNTNCGIGANCAEVSAFAANVGGIAINGVMTFTTTDVAGSTVQALEAGTMTVDNTNVGGGNDNIIVAFVSDEFDPSLAGGAGVGISGFFLNDGGGGGGLVTADAQAEMDYYVNGGVWGGAPGLGSFSLTTPLVGTAALPTPYWAAAAIPGPIVGIQELVGYVGVDVTGNSEVTFPVDVEDDDLAALASDAPEPGSCLLLGAGLAGVGAIRRRQMRANR